jgi:hypothetical protein
MRLLNSLLSVFLPLCLASPITSFAGSPSTFQVVNFRAYIASDPGSYGQFNFAAFMIQGQGFTCNVASEVPMYSDTTWFPCEPPKEGSEEKWSFQITEGFSHVLVKRQWSSNG